MSKNTQKVTEGEWYVLDCLWEGAPKTSMELVRALEKSAGWAKSTTMTMISRMEVKGLIACDNSGKTKAYFPVPERADTAAMQTKSFLDKVYRGSVGLMMNAMLERNELSESEIEQLYAILEAGLNKGRDGNA